MEYFTDIKDGKAQSNVMQMILKDFAIFEGKRIHIEIKPVKYKRSHAQNAMWWSWIDLLSKETGEDKNRLHDMFKSMFLTKVENNPFTGDDYIKIVSSSQLNKTEFSDLTDKLMKWCGEFLNITLPLPPTEQWDLQFN